MYKRYLYLGPVWYVDNRVLALHLPSCNPCWDFNFDYTRHRGKTCPKTLLTVSAPAAPGSLGAIGILDDRGHSRILWKGSRCMGLYDTLACNMVVILVSYHLQDCMSHYKLTLEKKRCQETARSPLGRRHFDPLTNGIFTS